MTNLVTSWIKTAWVTGPYIEWLPSSIQDYQSSRLGYTYAAMRLLYRTVANAGISPHQRIVDLYGTVSHEVLKVLCVYTAESLKVKYFIISSLLKTVVTQLIGY